MSTASLRIEIEKAIREKLSCQVHYYSSIREYLKAYSMISALEEREGNEYLVLNSGEIIPFDQIVMVNKNWSDPYDNDKYTCACDV